MQNVRDASKEKQHKTIKFMNCPSILHAVKQFVDFVLIYESIHQRLRKLLGPRAKYRWKFAKLLYGFENIPILLMVKCVH